MWDLNSSRYVRAKKTRKSSIFHGSRLAGLSLPRSRIRNSISSELESASNCDNIYNIPQIYLHFDAIRHCQHHFSIIQMFSGCDHELFELGTDTTEKATAAQAHHRQQWATTPRQATSFSTKFSFKSFCRFSLFIIVHSVRYDRNSISLSSCLFKTYLISRMLSMVTRTLGALSSMCICMCVWIAGGVIRVYMWNTIYMYCWRK